MVLKEWNNPILVSYGTKRQCYRDDTVNFITPTNVEAQITFKSKNMYHMVQMYNLRSTHPDKEIMMALSDIKVCFSYPHMSWIHIFSCHSHVLCFSGKLIQLGTIQISNHGDYSKMICKTDLEDIQKKFMNIIKW